MERVVGWSTVAVIVAVTVLWLVLVQVTSCSDAAPGEGTSSCETGPVLGVAGTWIAGATGAATVAVAVWQIVRATRSAEPVDG